MENASEATPPELPPETEVVGIFRTHRRAGEYALVVLSMKLPYWMIRHQRRYYLCVPERHAEAVLGQFAKYKEESRHWPPRMDEEEVEETRSFAREDYWALGVFGAVLAIFFVLQQAMPAVQEAGVLRSALMREGGEWWRAATALSLHADVAHLAGNIVSGICFGILAHQAFRPGLAWVLIFFSGVIGNSLNALAQPEHASLGASTAVFGALGLLVGAAVFRGLQAQGFGSLRRKLMPLAAGVTVLLFLGVGTPGDRTDVMAHVLGFAAGVPLGLAGCLIRRLRFAETIDLALIIQPLLLLLLAWLFALT